MRNLIVIAFSLLSLLNVACSGGDRPAQGNEGVSNDDSTDEGTGTSSSASTSNTECDQEHVGCPCTNEGAVFSCGHVKRVVGSYVSCVEEFSTCENGVWAKCGGTQQ